MLEHVVVVTDSLSLDGGSAKVALGSAKALAERGLRVTIFAAGGEPSSELVGHPRLEVVSTNQGEALAAGSRARGALQGVWNVTAAARMRKLLSSADRGRTLVHVHGWTKALSASVIGEIVRARVPLVVTLHEFFTACPNGCLYHHREQRICTLAPMSPACIATNCDSRSYAFKLYRVFRQLVQQTVGAIPRGVTHYITVSDFSRRVLAPLLPPGSSFYAVDNPVEVAAGPRSPAETNRAFVFVGRLSPEKGGLLFAEAARRADVPAVFVGDGPERDRIARANPDARMLGWLSPELVQSRLREARCLVVPSLWYETLGLVVLEAAALGIPSIVPAGSAPEELIAPGTTGLAFERGNRDELAAKLHACAGDDELIERLSDAAYSAYWRNPPTMRAHVDGLLTAYEKVVDAQPRASRLTA